MSIDESTSNRNPVFRSVMNCWKINKKSHCHRSFLYSQVRKENPLAGIFLVRLCRRLLQDAFPSGILFQRQQAVCGNHELPVHWLQKTGIPLQRIAYSNQSRKGRMQKQGNTLFHLLMQVHDTQRLYAWTIYLRVRHPTGQDINWQNFQRTHFIYCQSRLGLANF